MPSTTRARTTALTALVLAVACGGSNSPETALGADGGLAGADAIPIGGQGGGSVQPVEGGAAGDSSESSGGGAADGGGGGLDGSAGAGGDVSEAGAGGVPAEEGGAGGVAPEAGAGGVGGVAPEAGAGGVGGEAGAGGEQALTGVRFDYFHDGASIRYVSELGDSGDVTAFVGNAPTRFAFAEADVDESGLYANRRQSLIHLSDGSFYRLDGQADAAAPPAPVQVTSLSGVTKVCSWAPFSHPSDRAQSELLLSYVISGTSCASGLQYARLPLLAGAADPPLDWNGVTYPLRDRSGAIDAYLRLQSGYLEVVPSYDDGTVITQLFPLTYIVSYYAYSLGDGRYFLMVQKANTLWDLYAYDTTDHSLSAALATNFTSFNGPGGGWRGRTEDALFFTATQSGTTKIYRLAVDGQTALEPLEGVGGVPWVIAVIDGQVVFSTTSPAGIYRVAADADFSASPTPDTILNAGVGVSFVSEDRVFYQSGNFAGVVKLDGTGNELPNDDLSFWLGCLPDPAKDRPGSADESLCSRVYLRKFTGALVRSYDASPGGTAFFGDAARGPTAHGALTPGIVNFAVTSRNGAGTGFTYPSFQLPGTFQAREASDVGFSYGIFALPLPEASDQTLTTFWTSGSTIGWL